MNNKDNVYFDINKYILKIIICIYQNKHLTLQNENNKTI